jgi:tRNA dimethylallyltransferase
MNLLLAIVGPTGTGKSHLAVNLAREFGGEIVNADSRQVYRYLDIGTAKPSIEERAEVKHHLFDIIIPDADFSLAQYQERAGAAIGAIQQQGKLPILVGGSGLYVWSILEGWQVPRVPPDKALRTRLIERAQALSPEQLYQELVSRNPAVAVKIDPRNVRRVIRALEVLEKSNVPFSALKQKEAPQFISLVIGLTTDRKTLYERIDRRVDLMIEHGWIKEVVSLLEKGYHLDLPALSSIGYKQIGLYLEGKLSLEQAVLDIKTRTHRFVRQQYNWFKLKDAKIKWVDVKHDPETEIDTLVRAFLAQADAPPENNRG